MPYRARPFLRPLVSLAGKVALSGRSSWSVLAQPRSLAVALTSLVARLPKGMVPLAIVLDVGQAKGTYLAAGVVLAALGVGDAAATPLQGWLVDRFGRGRVLLPSAAMYALALAGLVGATEAFTWLSTALAGGLAAGASLAGALTDRLGATAALSLPAAAAGVAALICYRRLAASAAG